MLVANFHLLGLFSSVSHENVGKDHGLDVLRITDLFAKLSSILKITPANETALGPYARAVEDYANIFYPCCSDGLHDPVDENAAGEMETVRKVRTDRLVFLWGFRSGISPGALKNCLRGIHHVFSEDFDLRLVDKSCAVVVFLRPGFAEALLEDMTSCVVSGSGTLGEMISEGLKAAGYEAYMRVCRSGRWEENLADSLDNALSEPSPDLLMNNVVDNSEIYGSGDLMIKLDDL